MRLILLILSFFVALSVFSQVTVGSQYYQILRRSDKIDRILHDSVLGLPKKPAVKGIDTGAIYYRLADSSILVWTGSQWRAITGLPSQTGNNGKYLTTNGSVASWGTPANFANTNLTFTGNRTHNAASNDLTFTNLAYWDNFSTERFYFEGSDGTSTGSINTGKSYVGLSRTTTGGKNSYIAINQNGNNEFQIGAYRTGANSNTYFLPDSIQTNKPIQYAANYGSLFNQRSLVDKRYVDSIITVGNSLTLQQVTDNGATTTNDVIFNKAEGNVSITNDGGDPVLSVIANNGNYATVTPNHIELYTNTSSANNNLKITIPYSYSNRTRTLKFPLTPSSEEKFIPLSIRLNGTTYTSNDTGSIELGTITGGISDTSRIVTTDKTQTITGRKTFNAAAFINKDSLPINKGKLWHIVVDTPTNQLMRQQVTSAGVTGTGAANRLAYWDGASSITSNSNLQTNGSNLGIGGAANASAAFDVTSTTQGTRPFPTMTTAQRNAISSPATGLLIFNSTDSVQQYYNGATWVDLSDYRLSRRISNKIEIGEDFFNSSGIFTGSSTGSNATAGVFGASGTSTLIKPVYRVGAGAAASNAMAATFTNSSSGTFQPRLLTNPYIFETRILADTCSATDTVVYRIGLELANGGSTATSYASHFAGFIYDPRNTLGQGASRFIQCLTRNSSNSLQVTSYVFKPNVWTKLKMVVSSTYCLFYIDDVLVYTSTSNLPTSTGGGYYFNYRAAKTVASGSNTFSMYIDYFSMEHFLDTKR